MIHPNWKQRTGAEFSQVAREFANPGPEYAPWAFWFWNDVRDPEIYADQARGLCAGGMGPGYLQARGFSTYLSEEWYECVRAAVEAAKKSGYPMGFCDERGGAGCGSANKQIPANYPEFQAVSLRWEERIIQVGKDAQPAPGALFSVMARIDGERTGEPVLDSDTLTALTPGVTPTIATGGDWIQYDYFPYTDLTSGGSTVNYLDRRLISLVEELVLEPYERHFPDDFGKTLAGVFMDTEGDYGYKLAWSHDLAEQYARNTGRDIRAWMPLVHARDAQGKWARARYDWFRAVSDVYTSGFFEAHSRWFEERGMFVTAHTWEERLLGQALLVGDYMQACRALTLPGIDSLFIDDWGVRSHKETQSVCEFEGRRFMSELLGCSGWSLSTAQFKRSLNGAITWGVNHVVLHGVNSLREIDKVGFPPDFYDWHPYWRYFDEAANFTRRASLIASAGHMAADTLLYNPMDSVWSMLGDDVFDEKIPFHFYVHEQKWTGEIREAQPVNELDAVYTKAMEEMAFGGVEYLITDDHYLNRMKVEGGVLTLHERQFGTIVLPPIRIMPLPVMRKLLAFAEGGGNIVCLGELPTASTENGLNDPEMAALSEALRRANSVTFASCEELGAMIGRGDGPVRPGYRFTRGAFRIQAMHRRIGGREFYWLANNTGEAQDCEIEFFGARGGAVLWDCDRGIVHPVPSSDGAAGSMAVLTFEPDEGYFISFNPNEPAVTAKTPAAKVLSETPVTGNWRVWIDPAGQPVPVRCGLCAPERLLQGFETPLASWLDWGLSTYTGYVDYETSFVIDEFVGSVILDLGRVKHTAEVWVNGVRIGSRMWGLYRFDINRAVRMGENKLRVKVGNLLINAVMRYEPEEHEEMLCTEQHPLTDEDFDAGLYGPVVVRQIP